MIVVIVVTIVIVVIVVIVVINPYISTFVTTMTLGFREIRVLSFLKCPIFSTL